MAKMRYFTFGRMHANSTHPGVALTRLGGDFAGSIEAPGRVEARLRQVDQPMHRLSRRCGESIPNLHTAMRGNARSVSRGDDGSYDAADKNADDDRLRTIS